MFPSDEKFDTYQDAIADLRDAQSKLHAACNLYFRKLESLETVAQLSGKADEAEKKLNEAERIYRAQFRVY